MTKLVIFGIASIFGIALFLLCIKIILALQIQPPERPNHPELSLVEDNAYDVESALLMIELLCHNGDYFACLDAGKIYHTGAYNNARFDPNPAKAVWAYEKACRIETLEKENKKEGCDTLKNIKSPKQEK